MQSTVLARGILSVHPSVRPSHSGIVSRRMKIQSCGFQHLVGQSLLVSREVKFIRIFPSGGVKVRHPSINSEISTNNQPKLGNGAR